METPAPRDVTRGKKPYDTCRVALGRPLVDVLHSLDASALGIVLVENAAGILVGTMTDGDVRRALLNGAPLDAPLDAYIHREFASVRPSTSRAEVLDLMQSRWLSQIPIVDHEGRLVGLHTLHEILGASPRDNWVVVMAGGRGERLRPLTDTVPKPMLRVAGRPILERIVLHLVGFGFRRIFLAVNYKAQLIESHFGDGCNFGCAIEYLREEEPLGTGGALSLLSNLPQQPVLVLNGDLLTQFDAAAMIEFHEAGGFRATMGVHEYVHTVPFGVADVEDGQVRSLREKPSEVWDANAGIYVLDAELISRIPRDTYFPITALVEQCLAQKESVGAFRIDKDWIDVGRQTELARARGLD